MISEAVDHKIRLICIDCRENSNPDDISNLKCAKCHQEMVKKFTREFAEKYVKIGDEDIKISDEDVKIGDKDVKIGDKIERNKAKEENKKKMDRAMEIIRNQIDEMKKIHEHEQATDLFTPDHPITQFGINQAHEQASINMKKFKYEDNPKKKQKQSEPKKKRFLTIRHLRTDRYGSVTVACLVNPQEGFMDVGFSLCSPSDTFSKRDGRTRALKRMNKNPIPRITSIRIPIDLGSQKINEVLMEYISKEWVSYFPRARWMVNFLVHAKKR